MRPYIERPWVCVKSMDSHWFAANLQEITVLTRKTVFQLLRVSFDTCFPELWAKTIRRISRTIWHMKTKYALLQLSIHKNLQWELWKFWSFFTKVCPKNIPTFHRYGSPAKSRIPWKSSIWTWESPTSASNTKQIHSSKACNVEAGGGFQLWTNWRQNWEIFPKFLGENNKLSKTTT